MSRRAVAQPRKSSSQSGIAEEGTRNDASPAVFSPVKYPKIHNTTRLKIRDDGFGASQSAFFGRDLVGTTQAADSETRQYRKISEIKNSIRSSASHSFAGFDLSAGLNPRVHDKSSQCKKNNQSQFDFLNIDARATVRISDILDVVGLEEGWEHPQARIIEPLINASALISQAEADEGKNTSEAAVDLEPGPQTEKAEQEEPPITVKSPEEQALAVAKPLKRKLKLVRGPEVKENADEAGPETEKADAWDVPDDNNQEKDAEGGLKIEFDDLILFREKDKEDQPRCESESKSTFEGPRPEMKRVDIRRAFNSEARPWSMDVEIALRDLLGDIADPSKVSFEQMAAAWKRGYDTYFGTSLAEARYPYIWIDVYTIEAFGKEHKKRLVSLVGANLQGQLRLLTLAEEESENPEFWRDLLRDLEKRGLANPRLFIGDSRLPLWQFLNSVFPRAEIQYCRNALIEQVLGMLSKDHIREARRHLAQIYRAESQRAALDSVERFKVKYAEKFPHAASELIKNLDYLFTYFRFPKRHWYAIGQGCRISRAYPSRALLETVFKCHRFRDLSVYLVFNHLLRTQRRWPRIAGIRFLRRIQAGKSYRDGRRIRRARMLGLLLPRKSRKRTASTGQISESIRSILSIFKNRPSSGKKAVFKSPGNKSGSNRASTARKMPKPGDNPESNHGPAGLRSGLKNDTGINAHDDVRQVSVSAGKPATAMRVNVNPANDRDHSKPLSGLERELLEDLKSEKVAI